MIHVFLLITILKKKKKKEQILKESLVRKSFCIMIRCEFRTLSKRKDGAKRRYYFDNKLHHVWQGSKYASDDDSC